MKTWFLPIVVLVALVTASPAFARIGKDRSLYEGLLAKDFSVTDGAPLSAADLRGKKVVLVASADFNAYSDWWNKVWRPGGKADTCVLCKFNGNRDTWLESMHQTDPHVLGDRVMDAFAPYAREVAASSDLSAARNMGGDYFVIVDYWFQIKSFADRFDATGGFVVLDKDLNRVFDATGPATVKINDCYSSECNTGWFTQTFNLLFNPGIERLRGQLGPP